MNRSDRENFMAIVKSGFDNNPLFKVRPNYALEQYLSIIKDTLRMLNAYYGATLFGSFLRNGVARQTFNRIDVYIPATKEVHELLNEISHKFITIAKRYPIQPGQCFYNKNLEEDETVLTIKGFVDIHVLVEMWNAEKLIEMDYCPNFPTQHYSIDQMYYNMTDLTFNEDLYSPFRMDRKKLQSFSDHQQIWDIKDDIFKRRCYVLDEHENMVHSPEDEQFDFDHSWPDLDDISCIHRDSDLGKTMQYEMNNLLSRGYTLYYKDANCSDPECLFASDPPTKKHRKKKTSSVPGKREDVLEVSTSKCEDQPYTGGFQALEEIVC